MIACLRLYTVPASHRFLFAQKATQKGAGEPLVPGAIHSLLSGNQAEASAVNRCFCLHAKEAVDSLLGV